MKFKANYNAEINILEVQFDIEAQVIMRKAALQISAVIGGRDPAAITREEGIARTENLFEGLKLLQMIARKKSNQISTTREEAELTLGLLCFGNLCFHGKGMIPKLMGTAVKMFACITPVEISALTMPIPGEVFELRLKGVETRKSLEILRSSPGDLSVHNSFLLSRELRQIKRPSRALRKFIEELETTSILYSAMNKVLRPAANSRPRTKKKED